MAVVLSMVGSVVVVSLVVTVACMGAVVGGGGDSRNSNKPCYISRVGLVVTVVVVVAESCGMQWC